jgi:hypothetical protein
MGKTPARSGSSRARSRCRQRSRSSSSRSSATSVQEWSAFRCGPTRSLPGCLCLVMCMTSAACHCLSGLSHNQVPSTDGHRSGRTRLGSMTAQSNGADRGRRHGKFAPNSSWRSGSQSTWTVSIFPSQMQPHGNTPGRMSRTVLGQKGGSAPHGSCVASRLRPRGVGDHLSRQAPLSAAPVRVGRHRGGLAPGVPGVVRG